MRSRPRSVPSSSARRDAERAPRHRPGATCGYDVERSLSDAGIASPAAEARWILAEAWDQDGALEGADDAIASGRALASVEEMLERRLGGEPLQYVLGAWSFRNLDLFVDRRVLIPRPETEITAQVAIDEAVKRGARHGPRDAWTGTDASLHGRRPRHGLGRDRALARDRACRRRGVGDRRKRRRARGRTSEHRRHGLGCGSGPRRPR